MIHTRNFYLSSRVTGGDFERITNIISRALSKVRSNDIS